MPPVLAKPAQRAHEALSEMLAQIAVHTYRVTGRTRARGPFALLVGVLTNTGEVRVVGRALGLLSPDQLNRFASVKLVRAAP
jgi:hypothetical protein